MWVLQFYYVGKRKGKRGKERGRSSLVVSGTEKMECQPKPDG